MTHVRPAHSRPAPRRTVRARATMGVALLTAVLSVGAVAGEAVTAAASATTAEPTVRVTPAPRVGAVSRIIGRHLLPGEYVRVDISVDGRHWRTISSGNATAAGTYTARWKPTKAGKTLVDLGTGVDLIAATTVKVAHRQR